MPMLSKVPDVVCEFSMGIAKLMPERVVRAHRMRSNFSAAAGNLAVHVVG